MQILLGLAVLWIDAEHAVTLGGNPQLLLIVDTYTWYWHA